MIDMAQVRTLDTDGGDGRELSYPSPRGFHASSSIRQSSCTTLLVSQSPSVRGAQLLVLKVLKYFHARTSRIPQIDNCSQYQ